MQIIIADVRENVDIFKTGRILAKFEDYADAVEVKYVSPFVTPNNKGFMAIPEIGTQILICKPDNTNDWYYMGSVLEPSVGDSLSKAKIKPVGVIDPFMDIYKARGAVPQKYVFSSPKGNKLVLSDSYSPTEENLKVMLESSNGMKVELNDSIGCVIVRNSTGHAMITITDSLAGAEGGGSDSISVECTGNVFLTSRQADMNITVEDGRTLNIFNNSTGVNRIGNTDPTAGTINIVSQHNDINILAKGDNQEIRLEATGTGGDVYINAADRLVLNGAKGVSINSTEGNINITGRKIYLN